MMKLPQPSCEKTLRISWIDNCDACNGAVRIIDHRGAVFNVIASNGMGWEHVSVSLYRAKRCPTWDEMCFIKDLFWDPEDCVIQFHPPKSRYVNDHPFVLHLWRRMIGLDAAEFLPPVECV